MAGYSGTPLAQKLGIKPGATVAYIRRPEGFQIELPPDVVVEPRLGGPLDVCIAFFTRAADITRDWPKLTKAMTPAGGLWVAWPKKASGIVTDITEQTFRDLLLPTGWVDNKVCAIDDTWSGLRFVLRTDLRPR